MNKKKKIFEIYANNFAHIKDNEGFKSDIDFQYGCFCPLCLKYFEEATAFNTENKNFLTLEHNPPDSLGGKANILTCKDCNSLNGNKLDKALLKFLKNIDSRNQKPNSKLNSRITNDFLGDNKLNSELSIDKDGKFFFNIDKKRNNPSVYRSFFDTATYYYNSPKFTSDLKDSGQRCRLTFKLELPSDELNDYAKICLLKIAYLIAFEKLGHIFILNNNLNLIREQIKNPDKEILTNKNFITATGLNDKVLGINIICEPKELVSFLICFKLKTKSDNYTFGVYLPGFSDIKMNVYEYLEDFKGNTSMMLNNYFNTEFDVRIPENALLPYSLWEKHIST